LWRSVHALQPTDADCNKSTRSRSFLKRICNHSFRFSWCV